MINIMKTVYEKNYDALMPYIDFMTQNNLVWLKIENEPYMPLSIDLLYHDSQENSTRYAIAHNFIQQGDVMADPDMEIRIYEDTKQAESLTFQQDSLGIYQAVYPIPGQMNLRLKKQLNSFLANWLRNLKEQGFIDALQDGNYKKKERVN